ncbi:SH3 domain-containing protein [Xanthovirga aplysinae]|uniref:SH3 domain-containing protein n=1 Tax=Xanthovirga aplysinae TaxID=2529853 RepID=UPI0012BC5E14|nr:SH3 domain-containing protein [Xanthovirga aplysinae]MTI31575.1 hypothetical protein [Xanthovirga aplysinae]
MQNILLKKLLIFVPVFFFSIGTFSQPASTQTPEENLQLGDSLFQLQKYTESFEIYQSLLSQQQEYSPAMLLKMAYIKEGLDQFSQALYYLNLYYLATANEKALVKMQQLAEEHQLDGYQKSDQDFFMGFTYKYYNQLTFSLSAFSFFLLALMLYLKRKTGRRPYFTIGLFFVIIFGQLILVNFGKSYHKAIFSQDNSLIMSAPSSASEVIKMVNQGHRVQVLDHQDVWVKIQMNGITAFTKENNLELVQL